MELASLLRVPVAPVGNGKTIPTFDHFVERKFYVTNPSGRFLQPDVPYTLGDTASRRPAEASHCLGEHTGAEREHDRALRTVASGSRTDRMPFEGLRVADFTAFWAGPIVGHYLAMLGADVVHVESVKRPDGIRGHSVLTPNDPSWWEWSPLFHGPNTNNRAVTLDLGTDEGQALARDLVAECDVVLENYSPHVMEQFGLTYDRLSEHRPDLIMMRMPAFGLSGPWRERTGYAQNMEQASGMAWVTGYPDGPPLLPNGMCDPVAGTHTTFTLLLALEHRRLTGRGMQVEVAMVSGALEHRRGAGRRMGRVRSPHHRAGRQPRPRAGGFEQNLYRTADVDADGLQDSWVAVAVENDEQWHSLIAALGHPGWAMDSTLHSYDGRRAPHDEIDKHLGEWCAQRPASEVVDVLWAAGVPVAPALDGRFIDATEQLVARGFFETVTHPITGEQLHAGYPVRFERCTHQFHRARRAPTLGQHNQEILGDLLHRSSDELAALEARRDHRDATPRRTPNPLARSRESRPVANRTVRTIHSARVTGNSPPDSLSAKGDASCVRFLRRGNRCAARSPRSPSSRSRPSAHRDGRRRAVQRQSRSQRDPEVRHRPPGDGIDKGLDPIKSRSVGDFVQMNLIYDTLLHAQDDGTYEPGLAQSYEVDGRQHGHA